MKSAPALWVLLAVSLSPAGSVSGSVRDSATDIPLKAVEVSANCPAPCSVLTDSAGGFKLDIPASSGVRARSILPGSAPASAFAQGFYRVLDIRGTTIAQGAKDGSLPFPFLAKGWHVRAPGFSATGFPANVPAMGILFKPAAPDSLLVRFAKTGYVPRTEKVGALPATLAVKLQAVEGGNLAYHKATEQIGTAYGAVSGRAVDGETSGLQDGPGHKTSCTETNAKSTRDWWQVDLGAIYPIAEVRLWNRVDCCAQRLSNIDVKLSLDKTRWIDSAHFEAPNPINPTVVAFNGTSARFIRVQRHDAGNVLTANPDDRNLTLCEVQVFAP